MRITDGSVIGNSGAGRGSRGVEFVIDPDNARLKEQVGVLHRALARDPLSVAAKP